MAETNLSVLDYETKLAFRRRTEDGWVPGLPKRKRKSEYSDYGQDGEILSALHSGIDAIKAPFANRKNNKNYILTTMSASAEAEGLVQRLGPSLWPSEQDRTPTCIDPTFGFDFSIEEHRDRIKRLFINMVMAKAFRFAENQSRSTDKAAQQQSHWADDESGDASDYNPRPREIKKGASKNTRGIVKRRGPYMTQRRREELRAREGAQVAAEDLHMDTGRSASAAAAGQSTPPVNDNASLDDQSREVIDLEAVEETPEPTIDAAKSLNGRGGKRRAPAVHLESAKRPRRATAANKSQFLPDHSQTARLSTQSLRPVSADFDQVPDTFQDPQSHLSRLPGKCSTSEAPCHVDNVNDVSRGLSATPDIPRSNVSDKIAPPDISFSSAEAPKDSRHHVFMGHASTDEHTSHHTGTPSVVHERPNESRNPQDSETGTAAASSGLLTFVNPAASLPGKPDQEDTREPCATTSTVAPSDRESNAEANTRISPYNKRTCSEPPCHTTTNSVFSCEAGQRTGLDMQFEQEYLRAVLKDKDVRLCFGDVDHVIMDLDGCVTMADLVGRIKLYLVEVLGNEQISYVDVARECDQEFHVKGRDMRRLRLLPGPGRERTYDKFLCLFTDAPPQDDGHSFKMFVHVKGDRGV